MFWSATNHVECTSSAYNFALFTNSFYRGSDFHNYHLSVTLKKTLQKSSEQIPNLFLTRMIHKEHLNKINTKISLHKSHALCTDKISASLGATLLVYQTTYKTVKISGPLFVIATVCSKWAARLLSLLTTVQLSFSVFVSQVPRCTIGSIAITNPTATHHTIDITTIIIQHLWRLVHLPTDTMTRIFTHNLQTMSFNIALNSLT